MNTFLSLIGGIFGTIAGSLVGSFVGFIWSCFSYCPVPGDNSESSNLYAVDVGAFYGGWLDVIVGGLAIYWVLWRYLYRGDAHASSTSGSEVK